MAIQSVHPKRGGAAPPIAAEGPRASKFTTDPLDSGRRESTANPLESGVGTAFWCVTPDSRARYLTKAQAGFTEGLDLRDAHGPAGRALATLLVDAQDARSKTGGARKDPARYTKQTSGGRVRPSTGRGMHSVVIVHNWGFAGSSGARAEAERRKTPFKPR